MLNKETPYYLYKPQENRDKVKCVWVSQKDDARLYTTVGIEYLREQDPEFGMREYFDKFGPYWTVFSTTSEYSPEEAFLNRPRYPLTDLAISNPHVTTGIRDALQEILGQKGLQGKKRIAIEKFVTEVDFVVRLNQASAGVSSA